MKSPFFDVYPLCVPVHEISEIRIRPLFAHTSFLRHPVREVQSIRVDGYRTDGTYADWAEFETTPFRMDGEELVIAYPFSDEMEYAFRLLGDGADGKPEILLTAHVYALEPDLLRLRPYKGDFHIHSFQSDGLEAPSYVACCARRAGFDFMALTDHRQYEPSREAMDFVASVPTDLRCYPGEEVHPPECRPHIINFGGAFSVNDEYRHDEAAYRREVAERMKNIPDELPPELKFQVAASEWAFDRVRAGGGVAMYCHPYWKPHERTDVPNSVNECLLKRRKFDVLEVICGYARINMEGNALAIARYQQERAAGNPMPVAGVSDSHCCDAEPFGWYCTLVFAESVDFPDLAAAIRNDQALAVEAVEGEFPRLIGNFRLVRYGYFLLREFFPLHQRLCREEGVTMLDLLAGDESARNRLNAMQGRVPRLYDHYWR